MSYFRCPVFSALPHPAPLATLGTCLARSGSIKDPAIRKRNYLTPATPLNHYVSSTTSNVLIPLMDSITSRSAADVRKLFAEDAFYFVEDPVIGERVQEMQRNGFPIESVDGLDFCKQNVLDDRVSRKAVLLDLSNTSPSVLDMFWKHFSRGQALAFTKYTEPNPTTSTPS
jgi:hypothetical protein